MFLEYAWDMQWCDPCAADPLSNDQLRQLGVFWLDGNPSHPGIKSQAKNVYVTRLHVRYDDAHFPEDLFFQATGNRQNFQGRYVIRHPWKGGENCSQVAAYRENLIKRQEKEAQTLANLTGWDINYIRSKMELPVVLSNAPKDPWWKRIWGD